MQIFVLNSRKKIRIYKMHLLCVLFCVNLYAI
jgi:hypothetical protein